MVDINLCRFCREVDLADDYRGMHFAETPDLIALPTLGCFVVGYSLIVPRQHITSIACQSPSDLLKTEEFLEEIRRKCVELFGPTIVAEHGTGAPEEPTAACCDHAHFHIVPTERFDQVLGYYQRAGGPGISLNSLADLNQYEGHSYLTLSKEPGDWKIWLGASRFPRQCIRRAISEAEGNATMFDWRLYPHEEKMKATAALFRYGLKAEDANS